MTVITSKTNETVKLYRRLSSSRKARAERRLFPMEGVRLITDAAEEAARFHCVLASESCMEKYGEALKPLAQREKHFYVISDDTAAYISETDGTQGLFAICEMPDDKFPADIVKKGGRYVVLSHVQDPGNMGTVIRTADAIGIDGIICVGCCDIYNPKTVRSTMGSLMRTNISVCTEDEAFSALHAENILTCAAVVDSSAVSLTECDFSKGAAVFIGNEGNGLSSETADRCDIKLTIRMHGRANSLNAAMAAGIIMWEIGKR